MPTKPYCYVSKLIRAWGLEFIDGTTKNPKKISGIAINGMTISVNEICDGSSLTAINDLGRELEILRKTAQAFGLPNADAINWSIIESSSSNSAATQKHFNDLLLKKKEFDSKKFDGTNPGGADFNFVENFSSIHLGVNLRKAFLGGASNLQAGDNAEESRHAVKVFVHQFCKVFGKHGSPEYGSVVTPQLAKIVFPWTILKVSDKDSTIEGFFSSNFRLLLSFAFCEIESALVGPEKGLLDDVDINLPIVGIMNLFGHFLKYVVKYSNPTSTATETIVSGLQSDMMMLATIIPPAVERNRRDKLCNDFLNFLSSSSVTLHSSDKDLQKRLI
uniref:Uncharacterized protein n=1 Tax=Amphimedon queenslandica TaxID=400682 RepID=A0A1X7V6J4_AMPQE